MSEEELLERIRNGPKLPYVILNDDFIKNFIKQAEEEEEL